MSPRWGWWLVSSCQPSAVSQPHRLSSCRLLQHLVSHGLFACVAPLGLKGVGAQLRCYTHVAPLGLVFGEQLSAISSQPTASVIILPPSSASRSTDCSHISPPWGWWLVGSRQPSAVSR